MRDLVVKQKFKNVAFLSTSSSDGYGGLGQRTTLMVYYGVVVSDIFEDMRHAMLVNAKDPEQGIARLNEIWREVLTGLEGGKKTFFEAIKKSC